MLAMLASPSFVVGQSKPLEVSLRMRTEFSIMCKVQQFHCASRTTRATSESSSVKTEAILPLRTVGNETVTAHRLQGCESVARVYGPGVDSAFPGLGKILTVDEFFLSPDTAAIPFPAEEGIPVESIVYYLEQEDEEDEEESERSRHGVQVHLESSLRLPGLPLRSPSQSGPSVGSLSIITHVRGPSTVPTLVLGSLPLSDGSEGPSGRRVVVKGSMADSAAAAGAMVRVVSGSCGDVHAPSPLTDILFLDVCMRPGMSAQLPIPADYGALLYILEGVGVFGKESSCDEISPEGPSAIQSGGGSSFQNEGHALWSPAATTTPHSSPPVSFLPVVSHPWSSLRFIIVGSRSTRRESDDPNL